MENLENIGKRAIKGIWIPIEIWESKDLTWNEKILFLEIDSFTSRESNCYFSNSYIANLLGITENSAQRVLSSLISKGYVEKVSFDGRTRVIRSTYGYCKTDQTPENRQTIHERIGCLNNDEYRNNIFSNLTKEEDKEKKNIDKSIFKKEKEQSNWREDFSVYQKLVHDATVQLKNDGKMREYMEKYYTNIDYCATIDKMIEGFWNTENGWMHCRKTRKGKKIDMFATLKKNMDDRRRIVYKRENAATMPDDRFNAFCERYGETDNGGRSWMEWCKLSEDEKVIAMMHVKHYVMLTEAAFKSRMENYLRNKAFMKPIYSHGMLAFEPSYALQMAKTGYLPICDGFNLHWDEERQIFVTFEMPEKLIDGYEASNRPASAKIMYQGKRFRWDVDLNKWVQYTNI